MTNVPGAGFLVLLAAIATLVVLPLLAGVSLLAARLTGTRIEVTLPAVHAAAILVAVAVAAFSPASGLDAITPGAFVGLLRFAAVAVAGGLLLAAVAEGIPIAVGATLIFVTRSVPRESALNYATAGYALGGVGGAVAGISLTGSVEGAALGALLAGPAAIGSVLLEVAVSRFNRSVSAT
ncbi:hypothetical protein [Halobellus rarus]|uniref:Uncharacterized protein n=1 Tax=Halobellus rarus TaxID=1126237 RepID=A0ABD6CNP3_9EURY|nr:hypothetical protein [Halobellus rarus]